MLCRTTGSTLSHDRKCTANTPSQLGFWPSSPAGQQVAVQPLLSHPLQHAPVVAVVAVVVLFVVVPPTLALLPWLCWLQHSSSSEGTHPEHHLCPLRSTAEQKSVTACVYTVVGRHMSNMNLYNKDCVTSIIRTT